SCVGRPWDKVFSEICEHINRNSAVQDHVRDHVEDFVATNVTVVDGTLVAANRCGRPRPLEPVQWWPELYVCPKTGLLKRIPKARRDPRPEPPAPVPPVKVSKTLQCHFRNGAWHLVTLAPLPPSPWRRKCEKRDVVLGLPVRDLTPGRAREK